MQHIGRLTFVPLDGQGPDDAEFDALPDPQAVAGQAKAAFSPFLAAGGDVVTLRGRDRMQPSGDGIQLIYAYGHAWIGADGPEVSVLENGVSVLERGADLLRRLIDPAAASRTVLILDTCHAAAFDPLIDGARTPALVVYAAGAAEKAIASHRDNASRLVLALARHLAGKRKVVDLAQVVAETAVELDTDSVLQGQTVSYRMHGVNIRLSRDRASPDRKREKAVSLARNLFLGAGGVLALALVTGTWFYWSHVLVDIDLAGLGGVARSIGLTASVETPETNTSRIVHSIRAGTNRVRMWLPADDVIVRVRAAYRDGKERGLGFHFDFRPGFDPVDKFLSVSLPRAAEVQAHPGMAYIPATRWHHGRAAEPIENAVPYWIDLTPPTTADYLVLAEALERSGALKTENSFLLNARQRQAAVNAVGLGQVNQLNRDLGAILGVIDAANSSRVSGPGDIVVGASDMPCPRCPAPMTRLEAEVYCASRLKRLPTDLEWELAVRGVDGRVYPWGNQFDGQRANVPGLPEKGAPAPALKPVDAYAAFPSPFGLIDTVGNAGDWVSNESGAYERVYMGATYQYNPEDATAFRLLPITDSDYLVRKITARCVAKASG